MGEPVVFIRRAQVHDLISRQRPVMSHAQHDMRGVVQKPPCNPSRVVRGLKECETYALLTGRRREESFPCAGVRYHVELPLGDVLPGMNAGASTYAAPSPIEGSGTAWVLLGSWALSPARPTPIHPRRERRGFSALLVTGGVGIRALLGTRSTARSR